MSDRQSYRDYDYHYDTVSMYRTVVRKAFPQFNDHGVELAARLLADGWHSSAEELEHAVLTLTQEDNDE